MKKMLLLFTVLFITLYTYSQENTKVKDTLKCVFMIAKKSVKYNSYTPVITKGFIIYELQGINCNSGLEVVGYLDEKKNRLKNDIIVFSFVPVK